MSEQIAAYSVAFYCDPCARRSGWRRVLAVANRNATTLDGWDIHVARRVGRPPRNTARPIGNDGGVPHGDFPTAVATAQGKRLLFVALPPIETAAQLICRRKVPRGERPHRPRVARTQLVTLAERAEAVGRNDAYV